MEEEEGRGAERRRAFGEEAFMGPAYLPALVAVVDLRSEELTPFFPPLPGLSAAAAARASFRVDAPPAMAEAFFFREPGVCTRTGPLLML